MGSDNLDDNPCSGKVKYSTADKEYAGYTAHGYMQGTEGWTVPAPTAAGDEKVAYTATPAYAGLAWSRCSNSFQTAKVNGMGDCGLTKFTGIKSSHRPKYSQYGNKFIPESDPRSSHMRFPIQTSKSCSTLSSWQFLMASSIDNSNGATCESIGTTCGSSATKNVIDASQGSGKTSKSGDFNDNIFRGEATCEYPANSIKTTTDVLRFNDKIRKGLLPANPDFVNPLMKSYCSQVANNTASHKCLDSRAISTDTGKPKGAMSRCSVMVTQGQGGQICRTWMDHFRKTRESEYRDFLFSFCRKQVKPVIKPGKMVAEPTNTLDECACVNRDYDMEIYNIMKIVGERNQTKLNPGCVYRPCYEKSGATLLDPEVLDLGDKCKVFQCNAYTTVIDAHNTNITAAGANINCSGKIGDPPQDNLFNDNSGTAAQTSSQTVVSVPSPGTDSLPSWDTVPQWMSWVAIGLALVFLVWLLKWLLTSR